MRHIFLFLSVLILSGSFFSCVTKKQYDELEEIKNYYESESEAIDSITNAYTALYNDSKETELLLQQAFKDLEQLKVTNQSLNRSYQEILGKYEGLITQNDEVLSTSSYEKQNLAQQLSARQNALDRSNRAVAEKDYMLTARERQLMMMEGEYNEMQGDLIMSRDKIRELEALLQSNRGQMVEVRNQISADLLDLPMEDLQMEERNGKIYLFLSQKLLFRSGSNAIDWKGKQALNKIADILINNPDLDIVVEGHTDSDGSANKNWDLSVDRATSVVKVLTSRGVDPKRLTAAGRGLHDPVDDNSTSAGKAANRRTEIILSPRIDEILNLLNDQ